MEYKTLHKIEINNDMGIEIRVSIRREFTDADLQAARQACDHLVDVLEAETLRLNPDFALEREAERLRLLDLFKPNMIWSEVIPNGYSSEPYYALRPWFVVTTRKGRVTLGWRKRVIEIKWDPSVGPAAETLFPGEQTTKDGRLIHAWGYDKAKQYIDRLMA